MELEANILNCVRLQTRVFVPEGNEKTLSQLLFALFCCNDSFVF